MKSDLIAPCGMNCAICVGYLRDKKKCPGCREMNKNKPEYCRKCIIMHCEILKNNKWKFCSNKCAKYPCLRLKNLDKRYRTKYGMSMIENLENINKFGIRHFIKEEKEKWKCPECNETLCVHRDICLKCGSKIR
jgi:1-deoxy-D-xylulose 5-phosphate reductoisomerase